jgi:hypothetical protein
MLEGTGFHPQLCKWKERGKKKERKHFCKKEKIPE